MGKPLTSDCGAGCSACLSLTECLQCSDAAKVLNMVSLMCEDTCEGYEVMVGGDAHRYCRGSIYVNPESTSEVELGTMAHPYKLLDQAFNEVWNHWTDLSQVVNIYVMEDTTNIVYYQEQALLVYD